MMCESSKTSYSEIAKALNPRDSDAHEAFIGRYRPQILGWCRGAGLQEADCHDVSQSVLDKLFAERKLASYRREKGRFHPWLWSVTRNAVIDALKSFHRQVRGSGGADALEQLMTIEARQDLETRLKSTFDLELLEQVMAEIGREISANQLQIFELRTIQARSFDEIAKHTGMNVATVKVAHGRVSRKIQSRIQQLSDESST